MTPTRITHNPAPCGGKPCIRGRRIRLRLAQQGIAMLRSRHQAGGGVMHAAGCGPPLLALAMSSGQWQRCRLEAS
ncbi:DUF433 domain-containing protein [Synechococcus sp. CS-1325]|uniref:DUF433 domain-containing protein n=1 Tax=unclassified Synechococcus TaxID=2626047 RepID=UPI000DAFF3C6|nr:DUF433 domain-containing protein [Synechococcus sp. CS-1325]MCT0212542.1 DUF433 domain-containing protein [Synechococcus sp. CS-1326]MCT0232058.1 DUF433 domain-containing protein [Synechococcus sp. CS-1327]PZU99501.1 MAG: hypothetical protein DCF24_09115 [Cyanobium sp.]